MKWGDDIELIAKSATREVSSLCADRQLLLSNVFLISPFVHALNTALRFGLMFLLYI